MNDLQKVLDGRFAEVRADVRERLAEEDMTADPGLPVEEYRALTLANLRKLAASGHPHRGFAGDVGGVVTAFAMLAFADLSLLVKAGVQWGLFGGAVQVLGTSRHHDRYLQPIMDGELLGCFAMTETGHGSDVQHLRTTATYDPSTQEFVVDTPDPSARKDYIGNAARDGHMAVVFAQLISGGTSHGVHALLVPIRDDAGEAMPGVTISDCGHKAGLNGVDNGRLTFDHVRVPREALLNHFGDVAADGTYSSPIANETRRFFTMLGTLVRGRISVAGGAGTATQKALTLAIRYGNMRRQFADPATGEESAVLDYLVHQRKLLPALATTYALHFAQDEMVHTMHELQGAGAVQDEASGADPGASGAAPSANAFGARQRDLETMAAGVKAVGTWHATRTIQMCREACGGAGYLSDNLLPQLKADTDVFTTFEGDNTVLLQLVAKTILSDYGKQVGQLDLAGRARFGAGLVAGFALERTGARALFTRGGLRDRAYQRHLFVEREEHQIANAAQRMRAARGPGADQFAIFNAAQDHLLETSRAHVDRIVFDAFARAVDGCTDAQTKALLGKVLDLHALSVIEAQRGFFTEHAYLTAGRAKAVTQEVNALCAELRPHARRLVDGFAIPETWLECPMLAGEQDATAPATNPAPATAEPSDLSSVG